ncbi:MAG: HAMP domain-containing protein [Lachnospiraceae bacterium]|nr:HAMP domain-containing protein [Lachnospiraceae bacterium]
MRVRRISLSLQILLINVVVLLVTTVVLGTISIKQSSSVMETLIKQRMMDIANTAAAEIDGDVLEALEDGDQETAEYASVLDDLAAYRDNTDLEYIYCMEQTGANSFIFTVDADPEDPADWGDEVEVTDALIVAGNGTGAVDDQPYADEWGNHYSAYSPVFNSAHKVVGVVGVDFSADWYDEQISSFIRTIFLIALVILVISILVILFLTSRISKSFKTLNNKISDIADGSGDLTKKIEISSGDEFEVIAGNMNTFIDQIRDIVSGVKNNVDVSVADSKELTVITEKATDTMNNLSNAISGVSSGALQQAEDVNSASDNVRTIVGKLSEMSDTVETAEECTSSMTANSNYVAKTFEELIASIQESMRELETVTKEMADVGNFVEEVTNAADVINSIANQTNLLSLNASIEAARAGEAGRGFAVVAEEIGKLAVQSNESSASIKNIMDELKTQTDKTIGLVTKLNDVMSKQEATSMNSKESLTTLFDNISSTKENFEVIRQNVDDINAVCNVLNDSISSLSAISQENASSAEITANACTEITDIINNVSEKADNIKNQSDNLGNMVGKYRV